MPPRVELAAADAMLQKASIKIGVMVLVMVEKFKELDNVWTFEKR